VKRYEKDEYLECIVANCQEERKGIQIATTFYILDLEEKRTFIHIIEDSKH
jgi:uncharacterized protein YhbP (UPF0306 family)